MSEKMSKEFYHALGVEAHDPEAAIPLWEELLVNERHNYSAWNNSGVARMKTAIKNKDLDQAMSGLEHIEEAVIKAGEQGVTFELAEDNVKWAHRMLKEHWNID